MVLSEKWLKTFTVKRHVGSLIMGLNDDITRSDPFVVFVLLAFCPRLFFMQTLNFATLNENLIKYFSITQLSLVFNISTITNQFHVK